MKNKSISNLVAASMNETLNSDEMNSLFHTNYKKAEHKHEDEGDSCAADDCNSVDDPAVAKVRDALKELNRPLSDAEKKSLGLPAGAAPAPSVNNADAPLKPLTPQELDFNKGMRPVPGPVSTEVHKADDEDMSYADDEDDAEDEKEAEAAYNVAIEGLLKASAALDHIGFEKGASVSLSLASLVTAAKKKDKKEKADKKKKFQLFKKDPKKDMKSSKKDSKKDSKDSKKDSKDSKKDSAKDSKKK